MERRRQTCSQCGAPDSGAFKCSYCGSARSDMPQAIEPPQMVRTMCASSAGFAGSYHSFGNGRYRIDVPQMGDPFRG